jgi:hypothetical protein
MFRCLCRVSCIVYLENNRNSITLVCSSAEVIIGYFKTCLDRVPVRVLSIFWQLKSSFCREVWPTRKVLGPDH